MMYEVVTNSITCEFEKDIDAINAFTMAVGMINTDLDIVELEKDIRNAFNTKGKIYEFNHYMSIRECN